MCYNLPAGSRLQHDLKFANSHLRISYKASQRLSWIAVALGAVEFFFRAIVRTRSNWLSDFAVPYISTRLWLAGANPYDPFISMRTWYAAGAPSLVHGDLTALSFSVYPPPTLLVLVPLAALRWQAAYHAYLLIGLLLYTAVVYGLVRLGWPNLKTLSRLSQEPAAMFFVAFSLGFAPVHTAFNSINIVLISCCAAILAILVYAAYVDDGKDNGLSDAVKPSPRQSSRSLAVGLLVGIGATVSICLKPTTGIFLLPWLIRERRWRWLVGIFLAGAVITVFSLAPLLAHQGLSWLPDYRQNVAYTFTKGGNADVAHVNYENTDRIDLQLVAYAAFGNRTVAAATAASIYACLLFAFLYYAGWRKDGAYAKESGSSTQGKARALNLPLLVASGCLVLGLLPSYSRVYAAIVLLPLVLWCFRHLRLRSARWLLLLLCDFLSNTSAIMRIVAQKTGANEYYPRLWDFTIGGHTCWILLAIGCLLVYAVRQQVGEAAPLQPNRLEPAA